MSPTEPPQQLCELAYLFMNEKLKPMEVKLLAGGGRTRECSWGSILGGPNTTLGQHCWTSPYVCLVIFLCVYYCCCCYSYRKVTNSIEPAFFSEPFVNSCQMCPPPLPTVEYPLKQGHAGRSSQWNCRDQDITLIHCRRVILRLRSELSTGPQWHPLDPGGAHMCPVGCLRSWVPFSLERLSHLSWTLRTWTLLICHFIEWSSVWCFLMIRF